MGEPDGLTWAYDVDSTGRGTQIGWDQLVAVQTCTLRWIHLERDFDRTRAWLEDQSGLSRHAVGALLAQETRPRTSPMDNGLILILRGVNLMAGADPEDLISVRLWVEEHRVITIWRGGRHLLALDDLRDAVLEGQGTPNAGAFVAELANHLVERMTGVLGDLDDGLDLIEEDQEEPDAAQMRADLLELRRQAITLRRHLAPQRDALARLASERIPWLLESERTQLREALDHTARFVEDLEAARERAAVTQEELASRVTEQLNKRMYALSIIAGIFLPLSFATGLLGINVGGIPGAESQWAFSQVCVVLGVLAVAELLLFKRLGWL